jgi:hypothetical protein
MPASTEDSALIQSAVAYLNELHRALTQENGAATLILADPELRAAVAEWGRTAETEEATTAPPRRLPIGDAYRRIRAYMRRAMPAVGLRPAGETRRVSDVS